MGGIKDMLSPPCQNMGGIYHPHPPQDLRPCTQSNMHYTVLFDIENAIPPFSDR